MKKALVTAAVLVCLGPVLGIPANEGPLQSIELKSGLDASNYRVSYFYGRDEADWITDVPAGEAVLRHHVRDVLAPLALAHSSWLGGRADDWGIEIAANATGIYIAGMTKSMNFPPHTAAKPRNDAFVTKLSPDGKRLVYTAFFPVALRAYELGLAVDDKGSAYLAGNTQSRLFPIKNAFQPTIGGGQDGFILKIYPSGKGLIYSSYLGGAREDCCCGLVLGPDGVAHPGGYTMSSDFPVVEPFQDRLRGKMDAFVARVSADGKTLLASTYLGGTGADWCRDVALDSSGGVYAVGYSTSRDFPVKNGVQMAFGGNQDAFVTKFPPADLSRLSYSTYLGGGSKDDGYGIAVDDAGAAYAVGYTAGQFPVKNAFQSARKGSTEAFVAKIDPKGKSLVYSTYLGGGAGDIGSDVRVDAAGAAYVVGFTRSRDFPFRNAYQSVMKGSSDAFLTVFRPDGKRLQESTFLGGVYSEQGVGIALDAEGNILLTGQTESPDFPSAWAFQNKLAGGLDAFVVKFKRGDD
ncbi:MAG: SBBP repeat-containing protein [Candidatus Aminicenantes bacterium]|nr:SBBP repeat-containing protein [Candidatus Aminicenantes bacterium]